MTTRPTPHPACDLAPDVARALADGAPVVALESTIISHGMPYPANVETARAVEAAVRAQGATPATIAVMGGRLKIGLSDAEMAALGQAKDVLKLSRADLAHALASGRPGATTVAATMIAADLAGIRVFATGGIGGVHRGAELSFDISADLAELSRTSVHVVCAGAKAILDLPKTFEVLETFGVPVVAYGADEVPAFWSRRSGITAPIRLDSPEAIAALIAARAELGLPGGVLIANPIPLKAEIPAEEMAVWIDQALTEAARDGVAAKAVTPFLLARIVELSAGRSLVSNQALILNNARLAAEVARALA
jgi:pseudouridine-5'-phosphate glycosidase